MQLYFFLTTLWCLSLQFCRSFSTNPTPPLSTNTNKPNRKIIPITVISGFLGSGKTTLLRHLLENKQGIKIAVIVNDVAQVNIDSKLVIQSPQGNNNNNLADGMVQLQNGCACCSLGDELLGSVSELVTLSDIRNEGTFDHILVECSGVADPKGIRSQFQEALFYDMPIMERVRLDTMITVIDCSVFLKHLQSSKSANAQETPELFFREGEEIPAANDEDENKNNNDDDNAWMKGMPPALLQALLDDDEGGAANLPLAMQGGDNAVADLLVSQTETADIVLLNKVDLIDQQGEDLETIHQIVAALNPRATVSKCSFGNVPLTSILAAAGGKGVVESGVVDDHRDAIQAAGRVLDQTATTTNNPKKKEDAHCTDPDCTDSSHLHNHDHDHAADTVCTDPDCEDESHSHTHHEHTNHHQDNDPAVCNDPGCTDPTHTHSHSHNHASVTTTDNLGIGSFVYRARKPFHPGRLMAFLRHMPIVRGLPEVTSDEPTLEIPKSTKEALQRVVRSKGFLWLGDSDVAANYWSHSGTALEVQCLGRWWSTLSRQEWPPEAVASILSDFDDTEHNEDDLDTNTVGDRRQEIVFIGPGLLDETRQADIVESLNHCLLDDSEWQLYKEKRIDGNILRTTFENPFSTKMLSY